MEFAMTNHKTEHELLDDLQAIRLLWASVLIRAILDYSGLCLSCTSPDERRHVRQSAYRWIFVSHSRALNSYLGICDLLNLDPHQLRKRIANTRNIVQVMKRIREEEMSQQRRSDKLRVLHMLRGLSSHDAGNVIEACV